MSLLTVSELVVVAGKYSVFGVTHSPWSPVKPSASSSRMSRSDEPSSVSSAEKRGGTYGSLISGQCNKHDPRSHLRPSAPPCWCREDGSGRESRCPRHASILFYCRFQLARNTHLPPKRSNPRNQLDRRLTRKRI